MLPSWRLARNNLAGRPGRTALMVGALALAASLVTAVSCTIGTVQHAFEFRVAQILGATDARIFHQGNNRFDDAMLDRARAWPEVAAAAGHLSSSITLVRADGARDPATNDRLRCSPNAHGVDLDVTREFREFELESGREPAAPNEILIDPLTADALRAGPGDVLQIERFGDPIELVVTGVEKRMRLGTLQRPRVRMDRRTLADAANQRGELSYILIKLRDGVRPETFCAEHGAEVEPPLILEPAELVKTGFYERLQAGKLGFVVATVLAFLCASFIVVTGLTSGVTEKQRQLAIIRCIGGTRGHLFRSELLAGGALGIAGVVIGVPLGIGLAGLLAWWFRAFLPVPLAIPGLGIALTASGSILSGLLGAVFPAMLAARVSPLQAMTATARPASPAGLVAATIVGLALVAIELLLLLSGDPQTVFWLYVTIGLPASTIGYFILGVPAVLIVTVLFASPVSAALRLPGGMLRRTMFATPFRHGLTAGALMVGITILTSTWTNANTIVSGYLDKIKFADGFAYRTNGLTQDEQKAIAALPFVTASAPIGYMPLRIMNRTVFGIEGLSTPGVICVGFDPERFFAMNAVHWAAGDPATALPRLKSGDAIVVAEEFLARGIGLGDRLVLGAGRVEHEFEVVGVVDSGGLDIVTQSFGLRSAYLQHARSCVFMDFGAVERVYDNHDALLMQLNLADDVDDATASQAVEAVIPGGIFRSGRFIRQRIDNIVSTALTVNATIAFAALLLACLGVGNVIMANIHSRRFEFGVLRAVGATRTTVAALILAEALLLALAAILVGTTHGIQQAWVTAIQYRDLAGIPFDHLAVPYGSVAIGWLVLIGMTLASALPAVRSLIARVPRALVASGRNG
ncbi:MAG: ABC transporter permease [Phycisphaerales bacterium]|nr:ABC transporter permease [Phycisphaerales bacterium]